MLMTTILCLTQAIYFEARGEPLTGQYMVAAVVLNRVESSSYPDDVCGVVYQKKQFEFTTRKSLVMKNAEARAVAEFIARDMIESYDRDPDLLWFYNPQRAKPTWADKLSEHIKIGKHRFMRRKGDA